MDFDARRRAYVNRPAKRNGEPCGYTWQGMSCTVVGAHLCEQRDARVVCFLAGLTPAQQDAYIERLFDEESWTVPPVVEKADVVALLGAHLRGDEGAINNLIDATNESDPPGATVRGMASRFHRQSAPTEQPSL